MSKVDRINKSLNESFSKDISSLKESSNVVFKPDVLLEYLDLKRFKPTYADGKNFANYLVMSIEDEGMSGEFSDGLLDELKKKLV